MSEVKLENTNNGSNYSTNNYVYESSFAVGPFIDYTREENSESINIRMGRAYAEDAKYANKTRLQLVAEALHEIITNNKTNKQVNLLAWNQKLKIPNDADIFEIQELVSNFVINNVSLDVNDYIAPSEVEGTNGSVKAYKKMYNSSKIQDACLSYIQRDYKDKTLISFGKKYSREKDTTSYMQMAVEAIKQIDENLDLKKRLKLKMWHGAVIEIPRDADAYEIQELLSNYVLKNASLATNQKLSTGEITRY